MSKMFVVCGLHRSGTTFVGEILKQASVCVVHEPLNERFGMSGVPIAYPFAERSGDTNASLLDDSVTLSRPWNKDVSHIQAKGMRRRFYAITGGKSGLRWGGLRLRRSIGLSLPPVCMKDPFMSLATPYLVKQHALSVLCMVRHPAAVHYSTAKQNWRFDVENLRRQKELVEQYGQDITESQWATAEEHAAASIALLWKLMWRISSHLAEQDERLKIITHESLCLQPIETAQSICGHFDIQFSSKLETFVREHSRGERAEAENGRTHDFKRDSKALVDVWRGRLNQSDEAMIKDIAGEDVVELYGSW